MRSTDSINQKLYVSGMRTFYKSSGFPGREALPAGPSSYKDAAIKAYRYAFNNDASQYWLRHGKPDPNYYHNVYPSKTIKSVVNTMLDYAEIEPPVAADALKLATNAADYLLSITYGEDYALANVPPTYSFKGLNKEIVDGTAPAADGRRDQVMNIYPAGVGCMYLRLEAATGDQKYFNG